MRILNEDMYTSHTTIDDLLHDVLEKLLSRPFDITTSRGTTSEILGSILVLTNPRARLSRTETRGTAFSSLGELLWYLSGSDDLGFISYYIAKYVDESEDNKTIYGAYGPRLKAFRGKIDQIESIIALLKKKKFTRRAVIQLFDAKDIETKRVEIPCTCTLQFVIRDDKLHMYTSMRSNDAFIGLPHDVFAFTMLQEIISRRLDVGLGTYYHAVASLHLYERNVRGAEQYLDEGFQPRLLHQAMPSMPSGDLKGSIASLLSAEVRIRGGGEVNIDGLGIDAYWADLIRILKMHALFKEQNLNAVKNVQADLVNRTYHTYVNKRLARARDRIKEGR